MLAVSSRLRGLNRDEVWLAILAASFAVCLAASWQRWADPVVDIGREINQPLRLANGEHLYSDVRHIYGPLSPWVHAALFRAFEPSLTILYADGIISAIIALALLYWLGRQVMGPAATAAATLNVMSLCVFKPAGNYILPYSYNSLHGAVLGLVTLAILTRALKQRHAEAQASGVPDGSPPSDHAPPTSPRSSSIRGSRAHQRSRDVLFLLAGILAGLTSLAKTEMGVAAVAAGLAAAALVPYPDIRRGARHAAIFITSAAVLTLGVYALVAARVGWSVLASDSWLLVYNMPAELGYYNSQVSGLADPMKSLGRMLIALAKLGMIAAIIACISSIIAAAAEARRPGGTPIGISHPWRVLAGVVALLVLMSLTTGLDRDKGPFLAMPFLLVGQLVMLAPTLRRATTTHTATLTVFAIYALVSLARMILHVRSGGAYASFLLPVSIVLFTYLWVGPFAERLRDPRVARVARTVSVTLMILAAIVAAGILAYRYRARNTAVISTARGTLIAPTGMGLALTEALAFIDTHTDSTDAIAVVPEGTVLTFLSGRRNPLREEIITPGYLDAEGEARAIRQLQDARTALILVPNRPTSEFGAAVFGRDYYQQLMRWIEANYTACAIFGPMKDVGLQIGDAPFFIRAYCPVGKPFGPIRR
jgi:hypothetical protein